MSETNKRKSEDDIISIHPDKRSSTDLTSGEEVGKVVQVEDMWQLKMTSLSEQNLYLLNNKIRVDCTFVVGEPTGEVQKFGLHRLLLSNASPVFDRMLNGDMAEKQDIHVPDIEPQTFKHLVTFIYSGNLDLSTINVEMAMKICLAAEKYMIQTLKTRCSDHLIKLIGPADAYKSLQFAELLLGLNQLADRARKILIERTDEVLAAPTFQDQFNLCSENLVLELVQQPELHIDSEFDLISVVLSWAEHQVLKKDLSTDSKGYKEALGPIFKHLRFFSLSHTEFAQLDSALSLIFTLEEKYSMTLQISLKDFSKIPDTLSQNVKKRAKTLIEVPTFLKFEEINNIVFREFHQKFRCSLSFELNSDIRIYGLRLANRFPDLTIHVICESTILIYIENHRNTSVNNGEYEIMFESPFIVNVNKNYTISLKSDESSSYYNNKNVKLEECNNLFTEFSCKRATNDFPIITGIIYKKF